MKYRKARLESAYSFMLKYSKITVGQCSARLIASEKTILLPFMVIFRVIYTNLTLWLMLLLVLGKIVLTKLGLT
jgi:hypothetical protein